MTEIWEEAREVNNGVWIAPAYWTSGKELQKIVNAHFSADNFDIVRHVPNDETGPQ